MLKYLLILIGFILSSCSSNTTSPYPKPIQTPDAQTRTSLHHPFIPTTPDYQSPTAPKKLTSPASSQEKPNQQIIN